MPSSQKKQITVVIGMVIIGLLGLIFFLYSQKATAPGITETPEALVPNQGTTTETTGINTTSTNTPTPAVPTTNQTNTTTPGPYTPPKVTTPAPTPTYGATIKFTDGGFEPRKATIFVGQTVRFTNTSNMDMWVASDIHPTHTNYLLKSSKDCAGSSFDECKKVSKGGSWDFKFDAIGSWDFHNHMKAVEGGTITVIERP